MKTACMICARVKVILHRVCARYSRLMRVNAANKEVSSTGDNRFRNAVGSFEMNPIPDEKKLINYCIIIQ